MHRPNLKIEVAAQNAIIIPLLKAANEGLQCEKIGDIEGAISALAYIQRHLHLANQANNRALITK